MRRKAISSFVLVVLISVLSITSYRTAASCSVRVTNTDSAGPHNATILSGTSDAAASAGPYLELLGMTFTQNFSNSIVYNVTAVSETNGAIYSAYLLCGLTDQGYMYEFGLAYDMSGPGTVDACYLIFGPDGKAVYPVGGGFALQTLSANKGDSVELRLMFYGNDILMNIYDWSTTGSSRLYYSNYEATCFVGLPNCPLNPVYSFSGLMTEQWHTSPYYGNMQPAVYNDMTSAKSSAWMWMQEIDSGGNYLFDVSTSNPVSFALNPTYCRLFNSSGATEYSSAYQFVTGTYLAGPGYNFCVSILPGSAQLGFGQSQTFTSSVTGGTQPYIYQWYLDGAAILGANSASWTFKPTSPGSYKIWTGVTDNSGIMHAASNTTTVTASGWIDVYKKRAQEPAPMGIADYGIGPNGPYRYATNRSRGIVTIDSLQTDNSTNSAGILNYPMASFQLNVHLVFSTSYGQQVYWIQNVAVINTSSNYVNFINNVWNNSARTASQMSLPGKPGNGTVQNGAFYYYWANVPNVYPGDCVNLNYPATIMLEVTSGVSSSGKPTVSFVYDDGYGPITYDTVTFTNVASLTSLTGFEVNGFDYTPYRDFYNSELILGGFDVGPPIVPQDKPIFDTNNVQSDVRLQLEYWNGHNYQIVPNAYNFGESGENIDNTLVQFSHGQNVGTINARIWNGPGQQLGSLYNESQVGMIDIVWPMMASGTLYVTSVSVPNAPAWQIPFVNGQVTVTLYPGTYSLLLRDQAGQPLNEGTFTVNAGEHLFLRAGPTSGLAYTNKPQYTTGETVTLGFRNTGSTTITLYNSAPWVILDALGNRVCDAGIVLFYLDDVLPGQSRTWYWGQRNSAGLQVAAGTYTFQIGTSAGTFTATFSIGAGTGKTQLTLNASTQDMPSLIVVNNSVFQGYFLAYQSWETGTANNGDIFVEKYDTNWNLLTRVQATSLSSYQDSPSLALVSNGTGYYLELAYTSAEIGGYWHIFAQTFDLNLNYIANSKTQLTSSSSEDLPSIIFDGSLSIYIVYQSWGAGSSYQGDVYLEKLNLSLASLNKVIVTTETSYQDCPGLLYNPGTGTIYVAYVSNETGNFDIFLKKYDSNLNYLGKFQLTTDPTDQYRPSLSPTYVSTPPSIGGLQMAYQSNETGTSNQRDIFVEDFNLSCISLKKTQITNDQFYSATPSMVPSLVALGSSWCPGYVVYVSDEAGNWDIWLQQLASTPPTTYNVNLASLEFSGASSNKGTIVFDGVSYSSLPASISKAAGTYSVSYTAVSGYQFDHLQTSGSISVASTTTVVVSGAGTVTVVYKVIPPPAQPLYTMKTMGYGPLTGWFYVPTVPSTPNRLKIEMLFGVSTLTGDQMGGASPYTTTYAWPDGTINMKDIGFVAKAFSAFPGSASWNYMAVVVAGAQITMKDVATVAKDFGQIGTYIPWSSALASTVTVQFNTGPPVTPDANGYVTAVSGQSSFTVLQNGIPIGALVTFW